MNGTGRILVALVLALSAISPAMAGDASDIALPLTPAQQLDEDAGRPVTPLDAAPPEPTATPDPKASPDTTPPATTTPAAAPDPAPAPAPTASPATPASPAAPAAPTTTAATPQAYINPATPAAPPASSPPGASSGTSPGFLSAIGSGISSAVGSAASSICGMSSSCTQSAMLGAAKSAASGATTDSAGNSRIAAIAKALSDDKACWSCMLYGTVYTGMRSLVDKSYAYFVSGTTGMMALATTILAIAVIVRVAPIVLGTDDGRAAGGLKIFFFRILVVFSLFLGNTVVSTTGSFVSDWFIDGPLAAGTELGTKLAALTAQNLSAGGSGTTMSNPFGTDLSQGDGGGQAPVLTASDGKTGLSDIAEQNDTSTGASVTGLEDTAATSSGQSVTGTQTNTNPLSSTSGSGIDLGAAHVAAAKAMLKNLHTIGVIGIVTGVWVATEGPVQQSSNIIAFAIMVVAGMTLAFMFFMYTITFGLRYIDALIRSMLIFSLAPIFAFLWIFDSTRPMALKALKAGVALAAVFAVSGIVFTVAILIMQVGFQKAFANAGGGTSTSTLQSSLASIQGGGFAFLTGNAGSGSGTLNWLGFFILVGSCSLSIACAKLAFDLASQMFNFGRAELGIGKEVEGEVHNVAGQAKSIGMSFIGGR